MRWLKCWLLDRKKGFLRRGTLMRTIPQEPRIYGDPFHDDDGMLAYVRSGPYSTVNRATALRENSADDEELFSTNMSKTLQESCRNAIMKGVKEFLDRQKRKVGQWFIDIDDWVCKMKLDSLQEFFDRFPFRLRNDIFDAIMKEMNTGKYRDFWMCLYTVQLKAGYTNSITIGSEFDFDQSSRIYMLRLLSETKTPVTVLECPCYVGLPRIFETFPCFQEDRWVRAAVRNLSFLQRLVLPGFATDDVVQAINQTCSQLVHLDLSYNRNLNDTSAEILMGTMVIYEKGYLRKTIPAEDVQCKFRESLHELILMNTSTGQSTWTKLEKFFPNIDKVSGKVHLFIGELY